MIRRPPRSTQSRSSAASDVYKRQDVVGTEIGEPVVQERIGPLDFAVDAPDGEVHHSQPPGSVVGLLTVNGDVATDGGTDFGPLAVAITGGVGLHELGGLYEHATGNRSKDRRHGPCRARASCKGS